MTDEENRRRRRRNRWLPVLAALAAILSLIVVPPLLSIGRYKSQITHLVSTSLGRPVHLSSVELRVFPRPGFVLTDLTVDEDPAYGAEPVAHANTVTAAIRLLSLWRGRLEISRISVDEASLNVVRTGDGRWNLDPFFRTAANRTNGAALGAVPPVPYLEATNSRVNIKNGLEKLPFSLVNADFSFWQEAPGDWLLRLRGQPARTDVNLDLAGTGIVRLEATLRHAPEIRLMPIHMEMEWREAQLGQLSRLIVGSDPGWRGDLTGQFQLDGTSDEAQIKTRLSATNVHRAEFAPADALDFDANCAFLYHYSSRSVEDLSCDSPLGDGHIKVAGNLPSEGAAKLSVQMQRIPVSAGLDILRTLRSGINPDLEARGMLTGELDYDPGAVQSTPAQISSRRRPAKGHAEKSLPTPQGPLSGSLVVDGFQLSGGGLTQPIRAAQVVWAPEAGAQKTDQTLGATLSVPAGGAAPFMVAARLSLRGYQVGAQGALTLARVRELAQIAGVADTSALDGISADSVTVDLKAAGPWLPQQTGSSADANGDTMASEDADRTEIRDTALDQLRGTLTLHNARWKSAILPNDVEIADATLHLNGDETLWDPAAFRYGPIKGSASLQTSRDCEVAGQCPPNLVLQFPELDAAALQAVLLGAAEKHDSAFSNLVARFTQNQTPTWPHLNGTIKADSIILGPVKLQNAVISFRMRPTGAELTHMDAGLLGGQMHATGNVNNGDKPAYSLDGAFSKLSAAALCQLVGLQCTGGPVDGTGKIELSGFSDKDLAASAVGSVHFAWRHGTVNGPSTVQIPKELGRFDRWTPDGTIANGTLTLTQNHVQRGAPAAETSVAVTFGNPPTVKMRAVPEADAARR